MSAPRITNMKKLLLISAAMIAALMTSAQAETRFPYAGDNRRSNCEPTSKSVNAAKDTRWFRNLNSNFRSSLGHTYRTKLRSE
jgi:hypothetical protein